MFREDLERLPPEKWEMLPGSFEGVFHDGILLTNGMNPAESIQN